MRVLLTGAEGQAGRAVREIAPPAAELTCVGRRDLDITDERAVAAIMADAEPDWIINAAAYTDVESAETDESGAFAVNATAVANLARAARSRGCRVLHVSTDYVFNGTGCRPLRPQDEPSPCNVYGQSKLAGERHVTEILGERGIVIRTSWLYFANGRNFVHTMLRLMGERSTLSVVADQFAAPTWARSLAQAAWGAIEQNASGLVHWRDAGIASWYDFAAAIYEIGQRTGLVTNTVDIMPVPSSAYATKASRPGFSLLDTTDAEAMLGFRPAHWRVNLERMLEQIEQA